MGVPEVPQESLITEYSRMRWRKNLAPDANPVECQMWDVTLFKALFRKSCCPLEMSCCCTSLCKQLLQSLQTAITYEEQQSILSVSHQISWPRGVESVLPSGNKIGYTWRISSSKLFLKPLRLHVCRGVNSSYLSFSWCSKDLLEMLELTYAAAVIWDASMMFGQVFFFALTLGHHCYSCTLH